MAYTSAGRCAHTLRSASPDGPAGISSSPEKSGWVSCLQPRLARTEAVESSESYVIFTDAAHLTTYAKPVIQVQTAVNTHSRGTYAKPRIQHIGVQVDLTAELTETSTSDVPRVLPGATALDSPSEPCALQPGPSAQAVCSFTDASGMAKLMVVTSRNGKRLLVHAGYAYVESSQDGSSTFWGCRKKGTCWARMRTNMATGEGITLFGVHAHPPDPIEMEVLVAASRCHSLAGPGTATKEVVPNTTEMPPSSVKENTPSEQTRKHGVRRRRERRLLKPRFPVTFPQREETAHTSHLNFTPTLQNSSPICSQLNACRFDGTFVTLGSDDPLQQPTGTIDGNAKLDSDSTSQQLSSTGAVSEEEYLDLDDLSQENGITSADSAEDISDPEGALRQHDGSSWGVRDMTKPVVVTTVREKPLLIHDGYTYTVRRRMKSAVHWKCRKWNTCRAGVHTNTVSGDGIKVVRTHTHPRDPIEAEVLIAVSKLRSLARSAMEPDEVELNTLDSLSDSAKANMPSLGLMRRMIRRRRPERPRRPRPPVVYLRPSNAAGASQQATCSPNDGSSAWDPDRPSDRPNDCVDDVTIPVVIATAKDKPLLIYAGYTYTTNRQNKSYIYWTCRRRNTCRARLCTDPTSGDVIKLVGIHTHAGDPIETEVLIAGWRLRSLARSAMPIPQVVQNVMEVLSSSARATMPLVESLKRTVRRLRQLSRTAGASSSEPLPECHTSATDPLQQGTCNLSDASVIALHQPGAAPFDSANDISSSGHCSHQLDETAADSRDDTSSSGHFSHHLHEATADSRDNLTSSGDSSHQLGESAADSIEEQVPILNEHCSSDIPAKSCDAIVEDFGLMLQHLPHFSISDSGRSCHQLGETAAESTDKISVPGHPHRLHEPGETAAGSINNTAKPTIITTPKSKPLLIYDGHAYTMNRRNRSSIRWVCRKRKKCSVRLYTDPDRWDIVKLVGVHTHVADPVETEVLLAGSRLRSLARSAIPVPEVVRSVVEALSSPAKAFMPTLETLKRTVRRQRRLATDAGAQSSDGPPLECHASATDPPPQSTCSFSGAICALGLDDFLQKTNETAVDGAEGTLGLDDSPEKPDETAVDSAERVCSIDGPLCQLGRAAADISEKGPLDADGNSQPFGDATAGSAEVGSMAKPVVVESRKNKPLLICAGYAYTMNRDSKLTTYWVCRKRETCCARVSTSPASGEITNIFGKHTHPADLIEAEVLIAAAKFRSLSRSRMSACEVIERTLEGLSSPARERMPSRESMVRAVHRLRKHSREAEASQLDAPKESDTFAVPSPQATTGLDDTS